MRQAYAALAVLAAAILCASAPAALGHGAGYELLPAKDVGGRQAALEISSSGFPDGPERQIRLALLDIDTQVTVRDVTYGVAASKGGQALFEGEFEAGDGQLAFVLVPGGSGSITAAPENRAGFFESVIGGQDNVVRLEGGGLEGGGLYELDIAVLTAGSFSERLDPPVRYEAGISLPEKTSYVVEDPDYGAQQISLITYYDKISGFSYDPAERAMRFFMPFDWGIEAINQTSVVHEEAVIDRSFGDLMASEYEARVNGAVLPDRTITIDDYTDQGRTIHIVISQSDLADLPRGRGMDFVLGPVPGAPLGTVTSNGQYRVYLDTDPPELQSGSEAAFLFRIDDIFLENKPAAAKYRFSLAFEGKEFHSESGTSTDERGQYDMARVKIPDWASGIIEARFDDVGGAELADARLHVATDRANADPARDAASRWAAGLASDEELAGALGLEAGGEFAPPAWLRQVAKWLAEGQITASEFAGAWQHVSAPSSWP